jgi:3-dehydroquinate dehydratase/shikimate dehydrogenase
MTTGEVMICISINQESRRMALVDMINAASQCDLVEVRLDRFGRAPELGELLSHKPRPVIMSCRRTEDGGNWDGTEDERLSLLRQCIISKADYVEIELDVADQIRPFPPAKRVISYTNLGETPGDIADIYAEAQTKKPDVIKLTTLARTPEEAWPLVQILAKPAVPTVVVGLGKPGVMLTVLGKKIGAPWTYAALEKGMEAYPGQPTVSDLHTIYHYEAIGKTTRLIGLTGFDGREQVATAVLNHVLAHYQLPARCLPLGVGSLRLFRKVIDAAKLAAVVVDAEHQEMLAGMAEELNASAQAAKSADLLLHKGDKWHGYHTALQAAVNALLAVLGPKFGGDNPIQNRMIGIVGVNGVARGMAMELQRRGASVILASHQKKAGLELAKELGCRFVQFEALYSTMHDVLIVVDEEKDQMPARPGSSSSSGIHTGYLKPGMTVMDLTAGLSDTTLTTNAAARSCLVVRARQLLVEQLRLQAQMLTSKQVPTEVLTAVLPAWMTEGEGNA